MKISTYKGKSLASKNVGIFSTSLLVAAVATYIYSPVIGTNAANNVNTDVNASINPVASITLDTSTLNFNITPTPEGQFDSKTVTATVGTNSTGGYELYFSSEDNNTAMTHSDSNISNTIASDFSGTVTSSTMASNKWGYSLDNTNFSKIPAANAQATIRNIDHYPSAAEKTSTVRIGMKLDTTLPSGTYSKNVKFSVLAHETPVPMQGFDKTTLTNVGDTATLQDTRDGNSYTVKRLADGNVWMTENLRLIDKTISSADSNLPSGETYTVPASNRSRFGTDYNTNAAYIDSTYGGYYNFYTATAGWGTNSETSGNSPKDICPKGWRLPTGGSSGEFQTLYNNYNSASSMMGVPNFTLSGDVSGGSVSGRGSRGSFWSSTVNGASSAYYLGLKNTSVYPAYSSGKNDGQSVRCIAI